MKKILISVYLLSSLYSFGAVSLVRISELPSTNSSSTNDLMAIVAQPFTSNADTKRITVQQFLDSVIKPAIVTTNLYVSNIFTTNIVVGSNNVVLGPIEAPKVTYALSTNLLGASPLSVLDSNTVATPSLITSNSLTGYGAGTNYIHGLYVGKSFSVTNMVYDMRSFGVVGNGTDESALVQAVFDSFGAKGATVRFADAESNYKFSVTVTNRMHIIGPQYTKDYSSGITNYFAPANSSSPVFRFGDGTNLIRGAVLENITLYDPAGAGQGLYLSTVYEAVFRDIACWNFTNCVYIKAGNGTQPCSLNKIYNLVYQQANIDNTRGINMVMPANQNSFTTAIEFYGIHGNGLTGKTNAWLCEFDGCVPTFIGGYLDLQGGNGNSILLSKRNAGALEPYIMTSGGTVFDGAGSVAIVVLDSTTSGGYPYDRILQVGLSSGKIRMKTGDEYNIPSFAASTPYLYNPAILSGMEFAKSGEFVPTGHLFITTGTNDDMTIGSTNTINIVAGTLNGVYLSPFLSVNGSIFVPNNYGLRSRTVAGVDYPMISSLSSDSVQIFSPKSFVTIATNGETISWSFQTGPTSFSQILSLDSTPKGRLYGLFQPGVNGKVKYYDNAFAGIIQYEDVGINVYNSTYGYTAATFQTNGNVDFNYTVNAAYIHPNNVGNSKLIQTDGSGTIVGIANRDGILANDGAGTFSHTRFLAGANVTLTPTVVAGGTNWTIAAIAPGASTNIYSFTTPLTLSGTNVSVDANGIDNTLFRQSAGVSVVGRASNSTGNIADIVASADNKLLMRTGGVLSFTDYPDDLSIQKIYVTKGGLGIGTRKQLNFIEGANTTITMADNSGANRVDVMISASGSVPTTTRGIQYWHPTGWTNYVGDPGNTTNFTAIAVDGGTMQITLPTSGTFEIEAHVPLRFNGSYDGIVRFKNDTTASWDSPYYYIDATSMGNANYINMKSFITTTTINNVITVYAADLGLTYTSTYITGTPWISYLRVQ